MIEPGRVVRFFGIAALLAAGVAPAAAQGHPNERRLQLEEQVRERFLEVATRRLDLTGDQRGRLAAVLEEGAAARRRLRGESVELRRHLMEATRDPSATDATFEEVLRRMETLREREHALERREQQQLAAFLSPRQRALFLAMRMSFNEQVRELRGRGPPR